MFGRTSAMKAMTRAEPEHNDPTAKGPGGEVKLAMVAAAGIGVVGTLAALAVWGGKPALGVLVGALLATGNLWAFKLLGHAFLSSTGTSRAMWGLLGAFKFVALLLVVLVLVLRGVVEPLPLLVGYAALPVGITLAGLVANRTHHDRP